MPGARKVTGWRVPVGSRWTSEKKTTSTTGMADGEQQRLAPAQGHPHLGPGLGHQPPERQRPHRVSPALVPSSSSVRRSRSVAAGVWRLVRLEIGVLQGTAPGPQVGQGQVAFVEPGGQRGHPTGRGRPGHRYSPGRSSTTSPGAAPTAAARAAMSTPAGAPKRMAGADPVAASSATVPRATARPPAMMTTSSASRSASASSWVVSTHADPAARSSRDDLADGQPALGVDPGRRLVQEDHLGPAHQGQGQRQPLLLAARQPPPGRAGHRPQARPGRAGPRGPRATGSSGRRGRGPAAAPSPGRPRRAGASPPSGPPGPGGRRTGSRPRTRTEPDVGLPVALQGLDRRRLARPRSDRAGPAPGPRSACSDNPSTAVVVAVAHDQVAAVDGEPSRGEATVWAEP